MIKKPHFKSYMLKWKWHLEGYIRKWEKLYINGLGIQQKKISIKKEQENKPKNV